MSRSKSISIRMKLMVSYLVVISLCMLVFSVIAYVSSGSIIRQFAKRNVDQTMLTAQQNLIGFINDVSTSLLYIQINETIQQALARHDSENVVEDVNMVRKALMDVDVFRQKLARVDLYALNKDFYPSIYSGGNVFSSRELEHDPWFNFMLTAVYGTHWNVFDNSTVIIASKQLLNTDTGEPVAVVKTTINLLEFTNIISGVTLADTGRAFLVTSDSVINPTESALVNQFINDDVLFGSLIPQNQAAGRYIMLNGVEHLLCCYPLDDTGLYLAGIVKIKEFESATRPIIYAIILTSLFVVVFSFILFYIISLNITKPLTTLAKDMRSFQLYGDGAAVEIPAQDEIGVLYSSFNRLMDDIRNAVSQKRSAEMKALQAQIAPHFLYNTLNSIAVMTHRYNATDIEEMICALSKFFTKALNGGAELTTIQNELEHAQSYIYIQKVRFNEAFDLIIDVDRNIMDFAICKLILQPLVENCINHAFTLTKGKGVIRITGHKENNIVCINVADNGAGADLVDVEQINRYANKTFDANEPINKYGINNVNQRLKLYFGNEYGLSYFVNEDGGLTAQIRIKAVPAPPRKN